MSLGYYVFVVEVMKTKQNVTNIESHGNGVKWLAALGFVVALSGFIVSNIYSPYFSAATVSVICQALAIFSVTYTQLRKRIQQEGLSMPLLIVIYLFIGFLSIHYGRESAAITKQIGSPKKILFKHNNVLYRSNDTMIFLGETQSTLFVYHKNNSTTWILPRNDVDSMVILEK